MHWRSTTAAAAAVAVAEARKCLALVAHPFLLARKAGALGRATLNGPFYNSETSSEHVFVSVHTQGAGATLSGEVIAKPVSLAQQHRVIKDGNYSPVSSVNARALSRHDYGSPLPECTSMQVLGAGEPGSSVLWLLFFECSHLCGLAACSQAGSSAVQSHRFTGSPESGKVPDGSGGSP